MNQIIRFISLVTATLMAYWQKITTVEATANTAASDASNALSTANTAASDASNALNRANEAATDASSALSSANTASSSAATALSTAQTASLNASTANTAAQNAAADAETALSTANSAVSTANQYTDDAIQNLHLTAYKPPLYVDISSNDPATTLSEIEATIPSSGGNYIEGNYYLIPDIVDGINTVDFVRGGTSYSVTDDDVIVVNVDGSGAVTSFSVRKNNNVTRLTTLETTSATISALDAVEAKVDALDDKFSDGMDAVATALNDANFTAMWNAIKTQYPA